MVATVCLSPAEETPDFTLKVPDSLRSSLSASAESISTSTSASASCHSSILRTSTSNNTPTSSPSVTFAPLPSVEPRRRKSSIQLGVAARSRMLSQRRMTRQQYPPPDGSISSQIVHDFGRMGRPGPMWDEDLTNEEDDGPDLGPDPAEEAFAAIGRFVKGASRSIWRKVSQKNLNKKDTSPTTEAAEKETETSSKERESSSMNEDIGAETVSPEAQERSSGSGDEDRHNQSSPSEEKKSSDSSMVSEQAMVVESPTETSPPPAS